MDIFHALRRSTTWHTTRHGRTAAGKADMITRTKRPGEKRRYAFDFSQQTEITGGQTLTGTPTVEATRVRGIGTITVSGAEIDGNLVQFWAEGGELGDVWRVVCRCGLAEPEGDEPEEPEEPEGGEPEGEEPANTVLEEAGLLAVSYGA